MKTRIKSNPLSVLDDPVLKASRVITVDEMKTILQCGTTHAYDLLNSGAIRSYKDGSNRRIYLYSVLQYQERMAGAAV
jgi:excisionase family DNA binding protein